MSKTKFGVALLGCGTVGRGVFELLHGQLGDIESKHGFEFEIRKILVRDTKKPRGGLHIEAGLLTTDFQDILGDPSIDIVIEVMGGMSPTKEYLTESLRSGRHVITANKALMGSCGEKLIEKARQHNVFFGFSAAVTGFHQFVPSMVKSIVITELVGVFNGTTNFILTKLADKPFEEALNEAIELGYAEADHKNDTEGFDTRNKLVVATKLAYGVFLDCEDIPVAGIIGITKQDIAYAKELGYTIKLLGVSRILEDDKLTAFVAPALVPNDDPLASISGVKNGILVHDKFRGTQGMSADGAGKAATAMAIFGDLISVARGEKMLWPDASLSRRNLKFTRSQTPTRFYVRVDVPNRPGILASVTKSFARNEINIVDVIQRGSADAAVTSIVFMLDRTKQKTVEKVLEELAEAKTARSSLILRLEQCPQGVSTELTTNISTKSSPLNSPDLIQA